MRNALSAAALACAGLAALNPAPADAHVVAGARVFPVTLTFDDPGVGDEASLPAFSYGQSSGPTRELDLNLEYDKRITPDTAIILNDGYSIVHGGGTTQSGWQNLSVTGKWQAITNAKHEFVLSLGVTREIGNSGSPQIDDQTGATAPTLYFGKGLGDLPIPMLRPLAITGELSYVIPDRELKATPAVDPDTGLIGYQYNNGANRAWSGGFSVQYSIPYLQSQVKNIGIQGIFANMIPLVEFTWSSAASSPNLQQTAWTMAPGVIWMTNWGEIGLEALIPLNGAAGSSIGVVGMVHVFFDDLFPNSIGKPIFD